MNELNKEVPYKNSEANKILSKTKSTFCCIQEINLNIKGRYYLRVNIGLNKDFPSKGSKKQGGVAILISNKIDF